MPHASRPDVARARRRSRRSGVSRAAWSCVLILGAVSALVGCQSSDDPDAPSAPPGATYTGPEFLFNTVGSLAQVQNTELQLVSGFGLVVGLDGTGSSEVPQSLRQWMINEMTKQGVGRQQYKDVLPIGPEQLLASTDTAVVRVVGFIPGGAVKGSRFDLMVTAADSTTTSLVGGRLWTTQLSAGGANPEQFYLTPLAEGRGPIYLDPLDEDPASDEVFEVRPERRTALVVSGGEVLEQRNFELTLNQPSRARASAIADRINERYPKAPSDRRPTANAISPLVIQISIPSSFHARPQEFISLVTHTYIDRSPGFVPYQTRQLAQALIADPNQAAPVTLAWKALGPNARQVLREYYGYESLTVRLAALEAGAFNRDEQASQYLLELAQHESPSVRERVARALVSLPVSQYGTRALRSLLDDKARSVRIAAYESLASNYEERAKRGINLIERREMYDAHGRIKLVIDRIPVNDPLIYITQKGYPRLVIFNPTLGFEPGTLGRIWNDRLMVRRDEPEKAAVLFYQYRDARNGNRPRTDTHEIQPTLATLIYILAHEPSFDDPQPGYALTYGQVADAVYQLARRGAVDAEVEVDRSLLASLISNAEGGPAVPDRPETAAPGSSARAQP